MKKKLIRVTTVPISLEKLLENQLTFMDNYFDVTAISSDEENLLTFGKKNNIKTKHIELTRKITPIKDLMSLWKMYLFFKKEKPYIVHSHTPKAGTIAMLAAKFAKVPHRLHTVAGLPLLETSGIKRKILNFVEKITYWAATKVYPNSNGLLEIIENEKLCKKDKLKIIADGSSNGIDTNKFSPEKITDRERENLRNELKINSDDFVFIFVGRLVRDKGINELIEAFMSIDSETLKCKLLLVGPLEPELDPLNTNTLKNIDIHKNIISVGYQNDVIPYFSISNALVFPSYREGFPNVVMQAGSMGLPSIVTDINGCNEIISPDKNGLIIPAKNVLELVKSMNKLITDKNKTDMMSSNARSYILNRYEQKRVWEAILNEYNSIN